MATVRFTPEVFIYHVESHLDMTEDEIERTWYGPRDYAMVKKGIRRTVLRMQRGQRLGHDDDDKQQDENDERRGHYCARGLEHLRSPAHCEQHAINKDAVVESVLKEQERQRRNGGAGKRDAAEALALASCAASRWARDRARSAGVSDAAYVKRQLQRQYHQRPAMKVLRSNEQNGIPPCELQDRSTFEASLTSSTKKLPQRTTISGLNKFSEKRPSTKPIRATTNDATFSRRKNVRNTMA